MSKIVKFPSKPGPAEVAKNLGSSFNPNSYTEEQMRHINFKLAELRVKLNDGSVSKELYDRAVIAVNTRDPDLVLEVILADLDQKHAENLAFDPPSKN